MKRAIAFAVAAALAVPAVANAGADPEAGGTYTGKLSCRSIHEGTPSKSKPEITLLLLQTGADFQAQVGATPMVGYVVTDDTKTGTGEILLTSCGITAVGISGTVFDGTVKVKPNGNGKIKGELRRFNRESFDIEICSGTLSRTSAKPPAPPQCT
jgi:hypothetical protein